MVLTERVVATVEAACGLFVGTNLDDLIVLAVLNASSRAHGRPRGWQIWFGQYAGIAALVVVSLLAARGLVLLPGRWTSLLGAVPLGLGLYKLMMAIRARGTGEPVSAAAATGLTGVAALTVANGGDNVAAYTPVFRTMSAGETVITLVVFAVGVAALCLAGSWLVSHDKITRPIERWGHWIVPGVFIVIGLYVFHKTGVRGFGAEQGMAR